ncbi:Mut7-C RNAse domain-containing protein [Haloplanus halophilus]|uniref:Mut7-C RNAse domain-containing protein n=1 Tax=Haloplanus halophilus TaxID=2949993 RepID=UPI00203E1C61|nr:Mut7-C RNAse domain-containing protein [Haloplanus sp. GDY1]
MRFLCDAMLGKLSTYLRMCGHDAAYALDRGVEADDAVRDLAREEGRRLLTRDADLAARTEGAIRLTARDVTEQLRELREAGVDLSLPETPSRCGRCNGPLDPVGAGATTPESAPDPSGTDVWRCERCGGHFWKGSHWDDVRRRLPE